MKYEDGHTFDSGVKLIKRLYKDDTSHYTCQFQCPRCGNIFTATLADVARGSTKSCGCLQAEVKKQHAPTNKKDLTGQKFGYLTVIKDSGKRDANGTVKWQCKCDCGNYHLVATTNLINGNTVSCGCVVSYYERLIEEILKESKINYIEQKLLMDV